jgi:plasmid segregation protein ParM
MMKEQINEYVIALDLGKHDTKAIGRRKDATKDDIKRVKFRTKMIELGANADMEVGEHSYYLTIGDKNIIVGEQGKEIEDNFLTSKNSQLHKYSAYVAISKYLQPNSTGNKIQVSLACPLPVVGIKAAKENYKNMIKGEGVQKIIVNGDSFEFEITDIVIKSEDSCVIYMEELYNEEEIGIIGFGGLNMNFLLYKDKDFIYKKAFEHGAIKLTRYIADDLTTLRNGNIVDELTAKKALEDGYTTKKGKKEDDSIEVIQNSKRRFLTDARNLILQDGYDIDGLKKLVFVGGTTMQIEDMITKEYPHATTFGNSQWVAVEGLYKVAVKRYIK